MAEIEEISNETLYHLGKGWTYIHQEDYISYSI
jgi:hypothetical protein